MHRRSFLTSLAAAAAVRIPLNAQARKPILIAGGGLAGLCSAYELLRQGYEVIVFEARNRPGGRVETLRAPFTGGVYAEAGAGRVPDSHYLTMHYVQEFGLKLEPFEQPETAPVYFRKGRRESPAEVDALSAKYYDPLIPGLGTLPLSGRFPATLAPYDKSTLGLVMARRGATRDQIELMLLGYDPELGAATWWLQEDMGLRAKTGFFRVIGGNDRIPYGFADRVQKSILYQTSVVAVEQSDSEVYVTVEHEGVRRRITGERLIMTLPFPIARGVLGGARLSTAKCRAMEELPYTPVVKTFLQTHSRFWLRQKLSGFAFSDLQIERLWPGTVNPAVAKGVLNSYTLGRGAAELGNLDEPARQKQVLAQATRIFPELAAEFEQGTSKVWQSDPYQRGAFAQFDPGHMERLLPVNARAEGRIHFAGEHTSNWTAWMQGALESAHRVVYEVNLLTR